MSGNPIEGPTQVGKAADRPGVLIAGVDSGGLIRNFLIGTDGSITLGAGSATVGTVNIGTMPGAARTTDTVSTALASDAIMKNLTALTPKFFKIVASSSGVTNVVPAVTSKQILVLSYTIVANGAVNVKFQSHVTPTDLTGLLYFAANGGVSSSFSPVGLFASIAGEALDINLSGAVAVGGHLTYVEY